jgi:hypothetical protein
LEVRNIDPLTSKEELRSDMCRDLNISNTNCVHIKTPRLNPWETQQAIVVIPASMVLNIII